MCCVTCLYICTCDYQAGICTKLPVPAVIATSRAFGVPKTKSSPRHLHKRCIWWYNITRHGYESVAGTSIYSGYKMLHSADDLRIQCEWSGEIVLEYEINKQAFIPGLKLDHCTRCVAIPWGRSSMFLQAWHLYEINNSFPFWYSLVQNDITHSIEMTKITHASDFEIKKIFICHTCILVVSIESHTLSCACRDLKEACVNSWYFLYSYEARLKPHFLLFGHWWIPTKKGQ